jgi:adenine-specific DNA-methyltransferase
LYPDEEVNLQYPGKKDIDVILSRAPATIVQVRKCESDICRRLYFANNLDVLALLTKDPMVKGRVGLIYIDPPFGTQTVFHSRNLDHAYEDVFATPDYLEFIRERLLLLREVLADTGSIYVHLDAKMVFHVKLLMDEIFGTERFRNLITRLKSNPKNFTRRQFGNTSDYILFYTKGKHYVWNRPSEPWTPERAREYQYVDSGSGRRYMKVPVHAPGTRNGETGKPWKGMLPPPGKHWQFPPSVLDGMDRDGRIYWSKNGNPRRKIYLDESPGVSVQDIWLEFRDAQNQMAKITGYPTEKNEGLLERIIQASSNPGDIVLDAFAGSGTTLAAAEKLGRGWIGIDNGPESYRTILRRFATGTAPMGDFVNGREHSASETGNLFDETSELEPARVVENFDIYANPVLLREAEAGWAEAGSETELGK